MDIQLTNITKTYPQAERPALQVDKLQLLGGEVHGILGESGSGKSTLLNLLALLDKPDEKPVSYLRFFPEGASAPGHGWGGTQADHPGHSLIDSDDAWRLRYYSFVFQSGYLQENFTVLDNVVMPQRLQGAHTAEARARAEEQLRSFRIPEDKWGDLPRQLSGGQYQRVAVARALAHRPHVLFADEPTGSLDSGTGDAVMQDLVAWKNERPGNLLVLVTHSAAHVLKHCDSITVLRDGCVIEHGPKAKFNQQQITDAMKSKTTAV